jgi:hypothetical protein
MMERARGEKKTILLLVVVLVVVVAMDPIMLLREQN